MTSKTLDLDHFRRLLIAHREELLEDVATGKSAGETVELDQTRQGRLSRMDSMQQQAMARETGRRRELELSRIAAALRRIESGEYGECTSCGEMIPVGRLEADPAAAECVTCAEKSGG